ncbi:hypothetical protein WMY93_002185 [Mugilogobius chulae]|uniref:Uncharacterized protein n=1 Tax=Mugilogobius chulae TaxID=88201 RepID=A0AAW0PVT6_9GOBI
MIKANVNPKLLNASPAVPPRLFRKQDNTLGPGGAADSCSSWVCASGGAGPMSESGPCLWTQLPQSSPAPCERFKLACCGHQQYVYVLGGRHTTCERDFWRYNVVCNEWTELNCTSEEAPEALEGHSVVVHEGFLLVFGGMLDCVYTSLRCPLWVFDILKQKWVNWHGKLPQAEIPSNRKGHSAVVIGSAMLVYGGYIDLKGSSQEFWSLNLDSMVWSPVPAPHRPH